jgi:nucleotide-binding universal stress UspA family protein
MQVEVSNMIIVVGIDDTPHSVCVIEHGLRQAKLQNAELHIVHVFHLPPTVTAGYGIFPVDVQKLAAAERARVWEQVQGHVDRSGLEVQRVDLEGYPPDTLVHYVENVGASLLVVGTRGRGELASMILGSTSHRAIHLAHCDVLVVKPDRPA